jgi:ribose transport system substrate-binding protein
MREAGMRIVASQSARWEQSTANTVSSAILREHPDLKAILASNDNMALGAATAIRQAGKGGQVAVVGFDNISAIRQMLQDGRVLATADQHADRLAVYGIEYALRMLDGEARPQGRETPVDLVMRAGP